MGSYLFKDIVDPLKYVVDKEYKHPHLFFSNKPTYKHTRKHSNHTPTLSPINGGEGERSESRRKIGFTAEAQRARRKSFPGSSSWIESLF